MEYYVYNEDFNNKEIVSYNIFKNAQFMDGLTEAYIQFTKDEDLGKFKEEVRHQLMYSYWGKSEYETVITSWPPYIDVEDIDKLKEEVNKHNTQYVWKQLRINVNPIVGEKVSIYDQVMLNFDIFFNYVLAHASELKIKRMKKKK